MKTCECGDKHCPVHRGRVCENESTTTLWRVDMEGCLDFCEACADDAMESGLFTDDPVMGNEDEEVLS